MLKLTPGGIPEAILRGIPKRIPKVCEGSPGLIPGGVLQRILGGIPEEIPRRVPRAIFEGILKIIREVVPEKNTEGILE